MRQSIKYVGYLVAVIFVFTSAIYIVQQALISDNRYEFGINFVSSFVELILTVGLLGIVAQFQRSRQERKRLILEMASPDKPIATEAIRKLRAHHWLDNLGYVNLTCANLSDADLFFVDLSVPTGLVKLGLAHHSKLANVDLCGAYLGFSDLRRVDFFNADLTGVNFEFANLRGANFRQAKLIDVTLPDGSKCDGATPEARLAQIQKFVDKKQPTAFIVRRYKWFALRRPYSKGLHFGKETNNDSKQEAEIKIESIDFKGQDLSNQDLGGSNFSDRNLTGVNFSRADLRGANLRDAILTGVNFDGANLFFVRYNEGTIFPNGKKLKKSDVMMIPVKSWHRFEKLMTKKGVWENESHTNPTDTQNDSVFDQNSRELYVDDEQSSKSINS